MMTMDDLEKSLNTPLIRPENPPTSPRPISTNWGFSQETSRAVASACQTLYCLQDVFDSFDGFTGTVNSHAEIDTARRTAVQIEECVKGFCDQLQELESTLIESGQSVKLRQLYPHSAVFKDGSGNDRIGGSYSQIIRDLAWDSLNEMPWENFQNDDCEDDFPIVNLGKLFHEVGSSYAVTHGFLFLEFTGIRDNIMVPESWTG